MQKIGISRHRTAKRHPTDIATSLSRRRRRLNNPIVRSGWLVLYLIDYVIRCTFHVRFPRWLGRVVICDRYIYDAMVEIKASLPNGSRWPQRAEWLLALLCPCPEIAWLLDVPAELSVGRHADEDGSTAACEELSKQRLEYKYLATTYNLKVLPTSSGLDETSSQIVHETLLKYYENYATWINGLLLSNPNQMNPKKGM